MDATTATDFITTNKGLDIAIELTDGTEVYGSALSVNSKGVNVKIDGKTKSVALSRIANLALDDPNETYGADDDADDIAAAELADGSLELEDIINEISEGATTAEIAAHLTEYLKYEVTPKELRVHLRALGLGVGKGRTYALSSGEFRAVLNLIDTPAAS